MINFKTNIRIFQNEVVFLKHFIYTNKKTKLTKIKLTKTNK